MSTAVLNSGFGTTAVAAGGSGGGDDRPPPRRRIPASKAGARTWYPKKCQHCRKGNQRCGVERHGDLGRCDRCHHLGKDCSWAEEHEPVRAAEKAAFLASGAKFAGPKAGNSYANGNYARSRLGRAVIAPVAATTPTTTTTTAAATGAGEEEKEEDKMEE